MNPERQYISTLNKFKNSLLDLVFPPTCIGCGKLINSAEYRNGVVRPGMCTGCRTNIVLQTGFACAFCHAAVVNGLTCPFCRRDHDLSQLLVTASYEQPLVQTAIKNFKYRFMHGLGWDLGSIMSGYLQKQIDRNVVSLQNTIIVPVPLSAARLRWRGFNQAELLAQHLSRSFHIELVPALRRTQNQKPQAEIKNREDRIANMKNVFTSDSSEIQNKDILLIDDISTTGSTLDQCAKALKAAGANRIIGFVFARN